MADDEDSRMLERQVAYFASDAFLKDRADEFRGATPAECWAETVALCATLDWFLDRMDPPTRALAQAPEPRSEELLQILEAMQR